MNTKQNHHENIYTENIWYILLCKTNYVRKVAEFTSKIGIQTYYPVLIEERIWHDRKKKFEIPAFGPYLFVKTSEKNRKNVFGYPGAKKFLVWQGKLVTIKDEVIESIKLQFSLNKRPLLIENEIHVGDLVEILNGYFKGCKGLLTDNKNSKKIKVKLVDAGYSIIIDGTQHQLKSI